MSTFPARTGLETHATMQGMTTSGRNRTQKWSQPCKIAWTCERFARFCRSRFPVATHHHLAALTGLPSASVLKHLNGAARPGADAMMAYIDLFGPELLAAIMPACDWAERAANDEARREIRVRLRTIGERF